MLPSGEVIVMPPASDQPGRTDRRRCPPFMRLAFIAAVGSLTCPTATRAEAVSAPDSVFAPDSVSPPESASAPDSVPAPESASAPDSVPAPAPDPARIATLLFLLQNFDDVRVVTNSTKLVRRNALV